MSGIMRVTVPKVMSLYNKSSLAEVIVNGILIDMDTSILLAKHDVIVINHFTPVKVNDVTYSETLNETIDIEYDTSNDLIISDDGEPELSGAYVTLTINIVENGGGQL